MSHIVTLIEKAFSGEAAEEHKSGLKPITVRIEPYVVSELDAIAKALGMSRAALLAEIVTSAAAEGMEALRDNLEPDQWEEIAQEIMLEIEQ